jgi:SH3 domain protein
MISRNIKFIILITVIVMFVLPVQPVHADTQYVSDVLIVSLREGRGEGEVIKFLRSGSPLEVLEEDEEYMRVRTQEGEEGWVRKKFITSKIPKTIVIERLGSEIKRLKERVEQVKKKGESLRDELRAARQARDEKSREVSGASRELREITEKYTALVEQSKNVVEVVGERDRLKEENERLTMERERILEQNQRLKDMKTVWWFVAGGGVFFFGWIVGKASRKKRFY